MQPDFRAGLEILADVVCNATMPEKAVSREKEAQLAGIKAEEEEMTVVARNLLRAELFGAPSLRPARVGHARVRGQHYARCAAHLPRSASGRSQWVLAIFGDVRAEEVRAVAEELFGALPAGEPALADVAEPLVLAASREVEASRKRNKRC